MGVHDGHRDRKREQFLRCGAESFADHELLELLLYYAIPQRDTSPFFLPFPSRQSWRSEERRVGKECT